jgi:hypothetical protein
MHKFLSVYYFTFLLLHVSATVCHPQGTRLYLMSYVPIWVLVDKILCSTWLSVHYVVVCTLCGCVYTMWLCVHYVVVCTLCGCVYIMWLCVHYVNGGLVRVHTHQATQPHKGKGKAIPLQALTGPEGSSRLRLSDLKTIDTWRWQGCQPYAPAASTPRKCCWYSFLSEAESTPEP